MCIGSAKPVIEMLKLFLKAIPHHEDIICKVILHNDLWGEEAELAFSMAGASKCPTFGSAPVAGPGWGAFSEHWPLYLLNKRVQVKDFSHLWLVPSLHLCAHLNVPHMPTYPVTSPRILEWAFLLQQLNQRCLICQLAKFLFKGKLLRKIEQLKSSHW